MKSRPPKPAALNATYVAPGPRSTGPSNDTRDGVSLTVGQTEPGRRKRSSLFDGDLITRI
jgi:hypothetical protein